MADILAEIAAYKRGEIAALKRRHPLAALERDARAASAPRGFLAAIERRLAAGDYALIAEIKKASPSKGLIRENFDPPALAAAYQAGGATCLSVLTDTPSFQGSLDHLRAARAACALPVLRKDFMYDPHQVLEARAAGADCILLIVAMLKEGELRSLAALVREVKMAALVEVHNSAEFALAQRIGAELIGINNRDLHTFVTDLAVTERLLANYRGDALIVGESGIGTPADIRRLDVSGARAFLIGESLLRDGNPAAKLPELLGALEGIAER